MKESIALTNQLSVPNGSHILYVYSDLTAYIANVVSFVESGVRQKQHVVVIEDKARYARVEAELHDHLSAEDLKYVHVFDNYHFYGLFADFRFEQVLHNLKQTVQPFVMEGLTLRLWGHVEWREQTDILSKIYKYECDCDITVSDLGFLTVCAYDGQVVPAYIQTELMRTHEFFMTDKELVRSNFYNALHFTPTVFPSLSIQGTLESELDLYQQKIDFVHVVSHEVRNPLTIIKAYANLLQKDEPDEERRKRLQMIADYAIVIDNEIGHIISTEQMLSTESLWAKRLIAPVPLLSEVLNTMEVKARTQNISLELKNELTGAESMFCNAMGFQLIVSNILSNAIKYSTEGSTVWFSAFTEDNRIVFVIRDEGIGMSDDQIDRLFQKYGKHNQEHSGQGIGLYMVKKLLDHFDGAITVTSKLHEGSTFVVQMPLA